MRDPSVPVLRSATRQDIPSLSELIGAALSPFLDVAPRHIVERYIDGSRDIARQWNDGEVLVLESDGRLVGACVYYASAANTGVNLPTDWAGMRTLVVHPDARGRGLGRLIVDHCVDRARADRLAVFALHTSEYMTSAIRIYESAGFVRCPEYDGLASKVMHTDPALGDVQLLAYRLDL